MRSEPWFTSHVGASITNDCRPLQPHITPLITSPGAYEAEEKFSSESSVIMANTSCRVGSITVALEVQYVRTR